jgi:hypothetical protein
MAHALAQSLSGGSTQGQRQSCAQRQQGFKGFMGLHGVPPDSNQGIFNLSKSGTSGTTCVEAFDQTLGGCLNSGIL